MAVNRGKNFEKVVKESFLKIPDVFIYRLTDQQSRYKGSSNPCDFIVYKKDNPLILLECKSCHKKSFPFNNISDFQYSELLKYSDIPGLLCGFLIWFIDLDITIFIDVKQVRDLKEKGLKSLNPTKVNSYILVPGRKKRVFFEYDMTPILDNT